MKVRLVQGGSSAASRCSRYGRGETNHVKVHIHMHETLAVRGPPHTTSLSTLLVLCCTVLYRTGRPGSLTSRRSGTE